MSYFKCPNCDVSLTARATVDFFMQDPEWDFWGAKGHRWIVCKDEGYVHFRIISKGKSLHRLAVIRQ